MPTMTVAGWDASRRPAALLRKVQKTATARKLQLYLCGLARLVWPYIPNDFLRNGIIALEQFVDGQIDPAAYLRQQHLAMTEGTLRLGVRNVDYTSGDFAAYVVLAALSYEFRKGLVAALDWGRAAYRLSVPVDSRKLQELEYDQRACDLIRELFPPLGLAYHNSNHETILPDGTRFAVPETAVSIARGIVQDQAYDRLPILADCLEDANLTDPRWLNHLRSGHGHARGCWALDAVLPTSEF